MKRLLLMSSIFLILSYAAAPAADKITVFVSILPQKYFVEQIGRERVEVNVMVLPGASPATYEPKPSQMAALNRAAIYFSIGVPFEHTWLDRIASANPALTIVKTDEGIRKIPMASRTGHGHGSAESHDHDHGGLDPHIWLSPPLVIRQAEQITRALTAADPDNHALYSQNAGKFIESITALHREIQTITARIPQKAFIVFHPSWGYFAQTYGFEQIAMEMEGKEPKPQQLEEIIRTARKKQIRTVFIQPQFSKKSARLLAGEIQGKVATLDPLAENWAENLKNAALAFEQAKQ